MINNKKKKNLHLKNKEELMMGLNINGDYQKSRMKVKTEHKIIVIKLLLKNIKPINLSSVLMREPTQFFFLVLI